MALQRVETDAIQDDAVTTAKIAANAVAAADIAADAITNVKVAAGAAIAVAKISGLGTAATLTAGTAANNVVQLDGSGRLPAVSGANLTGVSTDTSAMENNIAILAFKTQAANNLAKFNLIDQVIDEYKDATGVTLSTAGQEGTTATTGFLASVIPASGLDSYTKLLLHMDDTGLTDSSATGHATTLYGSITRSSGASKFGGYAAYYDAASNGVGGSKYWTVADSSEFTLGTGDFTIDFWFKGNHTIPGNSSSVLETGNDAFNVGYVSTSGELLTFVSGTPGQWDISGGSGRSLGQSNTSAFSHHALVRNGTTWYTFKDGVQQTTWTHSGSVLDGTLLESGRRGNQYLSGYVDELRFSVGIARWTSGFTPPTSAYAGGSVNATGTATSTANTALTAPTTGDIVLLIENASGTATLNTDLKAYVSRNGGTGWDQATLVDKGSWGTNKKILVANNIAFSNSASGTDMRYKIEWANQAEGSKVTRVHATSLAWA